VLPLLALLSSSTVVVFEGMCDASGAVPIDSNTMAVADDEENTLRIYDATKGGPPLHAVELPRTLPSKKRKKRVESDLEAATTFRSHALWIASHGRNAGGKVKAERLVLFSTRIPRVGKPLELVGKPYRRLLDDLIAAGSLRRFDLASAARVAPKSEGGLNLEGLTTTLDGRAVLIGFRNPVPEGKALLVRIENPDRMVAGARAQIGEATLLDLKGLGIRALSSWRGRYLIAAGEHGDGRRKMLYTWDGADRLVAVPEGARPDFNTEAFFTPEDLDRIMILSDDGTLEVGGEECKRLDDPKAKRFRGMWLQLPR
jgi:hypothetical protein